MRYRFEDVELDDTSFELSRAGQVVPVEPQVLEVLFLFMANVDRLLAKTEILDLIWGDRFVSESTLTSRIKSARQAIGDNGRDQRLIKTVHGRGYRFVGDVQTIDGDRPDHRDEPAISGPAGPPPSDAGTAAAAATHAGNGFVGRAGELADLLRPAGARSPLTTVLIGGEAGIGKSRLVAEARSRLEADGFAVALGECLDVGDGSLPFVPIVAALRELAGHFDRADVEAEVAGSPELAVLLPDYAGVGDRRADDLLEDGSSTLRLLTAVSGTLATLAAKRPICIVIEDLHWVDASTRDLFVFLVRSLAGSRVLLVGTYRNDELAIGDPLRTAFAELQRSPRVVDIVLDPFDDEELAAFATTLLDEPPTSEVLADVAERSGGNPFYASEILAAGTDVGASIRPGLAELILSRVATLADGTQELLRVASVAGRSVADDLLEVVAGVGEDDLLAGLREAAERRIVDLGDDGALQFRHALMQDAVYSSLLPRERRRLHARYATALAGTAAGASSAAGIDALRAWHHRKAGQLAEALGASIEATRSAAATLAFSEALGHVTVALELWAGVSDPTTSTGLDRREVLEWAAQLADAEGDYVRAAELQREAIEELAEAPADERGRATSKLARYLWTSGETIAALEEYERAVATVPAEPPTPDRAVVLAGYGQILMLVYRDREARPVLEEAIDVARRTDARRTEGHATNSLGAATMHGGRQLEGVALLTDALAIATEEGNASERVRAYVNLAGGLTDAGNLAAAHRWAEEGLGVAAEVGYGTGLGFFIAANRAETLNDEGRWDASTELAESLVVPQGGLGRRWLVRLEIDRLVRRGELELAEELLSEAGSRQDVGYWIRHAEVAMAAGQRERAEIAATSGLEVARAIRDELTLRTMSIELLLDRSGDGGPSDEAIDRARAHRDALRELVADAGWRDDDPSYRYRALMAEAEAWVAPHDGGDAPARWRQAIERWTEGGLRWHRARALLHLASVLAGGDEPAAAIEPLTEGRRAAEELGAAPLVTLAAGIGARLPASAPPMTGT